MNMICQNCTSELLETFHFCPNCGNMLTEMDIIAHYFTRGFEYSTILSFLRKFHNIEMSLRTLKSRLQSMGLKRRNINADEEEVTAAIRQELNGPGYLRGYRSMWHCLRLHHGIQALRSMVQRILRALDPEGSDDRRSHRLIRRRYTNPGSNFAWHVDGHDKLKPYHGFPVHACIDGFSRRILWLKVCRTNNDPSVTAGFYLEYVRSVEGCPIVLRTDCGTENGTMAAMQCYFRSEAGGQFAGINAHKYGSSHSNQRIENWWSFLRRSRSSWWINFFGKRRSAISTHQMSYRWNVCGSVFRIYFNVISTKSRSTGIHIM